jgi:hypothetical protein
LVIVVRLLATFFSQGRVSMARINGARMVRVSLVWLASLMLLCFVASQAVRGADGDGGDAARVDKKEKPAANRLPRYYAKVVDKQQREKIYAIQREYRPKLAAARKAVETLLKEQNDKILAVLTPEQQKQVQDAAANSIKKKAAAAPAEATDKPPAASKPAATEAAK